jgi:hypothetical protein
VVINSLRSGEVGYSPKARSRVSPRTGRDSLIGLAGDELNRCAMAVGAPQFGIAG